MSGGSLTATARRPRREMGYFRLFNTWWSEFFAQNGRRPTKTDIETWRAENPTWRPELTLDEIVQHSKGRRDPEKNRQYFVEYRRKLKVSRPARTRGRAGGRAAAKRLGIEEPWEVATSDEDQQQQQQQQEDDDDDETDGEAAQTSSPRLRRQHQHTRPRSKPQEQDDDGAVRPDSPAEEEPTAATHMQFGSAGAAAAAMSAMAPSAAKGDADLDAAARRPEARQESSPAAAAAPASAPTSAAQAEAPVPILLPVRRTRGPMVARQLRCAAVQPRSCEDAWVLQRTGALGDLCLCPVDRRPGHVGDSPMSEVPAAAAAAPAATNGGSSNASVPQVMHSADASASAPCQDASPPTASGAEACQGLGGMGEEATAHQQPAVFRPGAADHRSPRLVGANTCGGPRVSCWTAGGAWHGALGSAPVAGNQIPAQTPSGSQVAAAATAAAAMQVQDAHPVSGCLAPEGCAIGLASFAGGGELGSSPAGTASTTPFCDPDLQRTCSTHSVCTGGSAAVANQPHSAAPAPPAALAAGAPAAAAAGMKRACPLSLALSSRPSFGDLSSCAPGGESSSPSASAAGAAPVALHEEPPAQQLPCKRRCTGNAPLQLPGGAPLLEFTQDGRHVTSHSAPSAPCRPAGHQEGSCALPTRTTHGGADPGDCAWAPGACSGGLRAFAAADSGDGTAVAAGWPRPASISGRQTPTFSLTGDVAEAAAVPCVWPVPALCAGHHTADAAAASVAAGQQHLSQLDTPGDVLEPGVDFLDAKWLDGLLSESEMDFLLAF